MAKKKKEAAAAVIDYATMITALGAFGFVLTREHIDAMNSDQIAMCHDCVTHWDAYKPGAVLKYGLASGGVDLVTEAKVKVLPEAIVAKVAELRQQIIDGTLQVKMYDGSDVWQ